MRNGSGSREAQQLDALVARLDRHRDFRDQRHAIAVRHHLHHRGQAGGAEFAQRAAGRVAAEGERLIAQAMALLQQDQPARIDIVGGDAGAARQIVAGRRREQERDRRTAAASRYPACGAGSAIITTSSAPRISSSTRKRVWVSRNSSSRSGMPLLQHRQQMRQHIGRDRRDDAEFQRAGQHRAAMTREILEIARPRSGSARRGGRSPTPVSVSATSLRPPLHQCDPEIALQVLDLHGQGRLADGAGLGGAAEMPVSGERIEIAELSERDHADKIILSLILINTIGPYPN